MATIKFKCTVKSVGEVMTFASGFKKAIVVVEELNEKNKYPNLIPLTFVKDRTSMVENLSEGDELTVDCAINGKEWTDKTGQKKYFVDVTVIKMSGGSAAAGGAKGKGNADVPPPPTNFPDYSSADDEVADDIPF